MLKRKTTITIVFFVFTIVTGFAQPIKKQNVLTMHRPASVSQLIAQGASSAQIKTAWQQFITRNQPKDHKTVQQLVDQITQKAYVEGNNHLAMAIAKVEYLMTVKVAISEDIQTVHLVHMGKLKAKVHKKTFKIKPTVQDLQKRTLYGQSMEQIKQQRITLIQMAKYTLGQQPSLSRSVNNKKNQRRASLPNLYTTRDVTSLHSLQFTTKKDLMDYLKNLKLQFIQVEKDYKIAKTQLQANLQRQQQTQHNLPQLRHLLYNSGIELVEIEEEDKR